MSTLYAPIHLDALALDRNRQVIGPTIDFEILPWFDGVRDRYPATPNVSGAVNAEPFADHSLLLRPGVHLHWTLPPGLTRGTSDPAATSGVAVGELRFPPAPNRWLVSGISGQRTAWMVESDYVHPFDEPARDAIAYPLHDDIAQVDRLATGRRFVQLGRQIALTSRTWSDRSPSPAGTPAVYLPDIDEPLTALGHLEPTFAALYANCRSVFGAHDPTVATEPQSYAVIGWYSTDVEDPLASLGDEVASWDARRIVGRLNAERTKRVDLNLPLLPEDHAITPSDRDHVHRLTIADRFGWDITASTNFAVPDRIVLSGLIAVDPGDTSSGIDSSQILTEGVGVGNTSSEALAAMLGHDLGDGDLEEQLEAVHIGVAPDHHALDLAAKFREARHTNEFVPSGRRRIWSVRPSHRPGATTTVESSGRLDLPPEVALQLHELNSHQHEADVAADAIVSARQRLFEDWYRLIVATYSAGDLDGPAIDVDELSEEIRRSSFGELERLESSRGVIDPHLITGTGIRLRTDIDPDDTIAYRFAASISHLNELFEAHQAAHPEAPEVELALVPGPRFWRPRDPAIALNHPTLTSMTRYGVDGVADEQGEIPPCVGGDFPTAQLTVEDTMRTVGLATMTTDRRISNVPRQGASTWNPLLVEWQVEIESIAEASNQRAQNASYAAEFVQAHFELGDGRPDLEPTGDPTLAPALEYLSGRAVVNPHTVDQLARRVQSTVTRLTADQTPVPEGLDHALDALSSTHRGAVVITLGGFHDGLLMTRSERQLQIDDPIGFASQRSLAGAVRRALGGFVAKTPWPEAPYHPIRSGEMEIQRLRLVDTFGQSIEWRPSSLYPAASLRASASTMAADRASLPLRISQGARLDLRWLSADHDVESNDHPATSPVCGWFCVDELDGALYVYAAGGELLGTIGGDGRWRPAPAAHQPVLAPHEIGNPHLAERVEWITDAADPALAVESMIDAIETGLAQIDPVDYAQHSSRALLVGRPVALVRASLEYMLQGLPAADQSWEALRRRLAGDDHADHGFTAVRFPIRIGAHDQLNDGVVGYWVDGDGDLPIQHFVTTHGGHVDRGRTADGDDRIELGATPLWRSLADPAVTLSLLVDPRAAVHATCGVLPVKALTIPVDQFAAALGSMRATFATRPVLTPIDGVELPLPTEAAGSWAWLQPERHGWTETPEHAVVDLAALTRAFPSRGPDIWRDLVERKIIRPMPGAGAQGRLFLPPPDDPIAPDVLRAIAATSRAIAPASTRGRFDRTIEIRDGWLQLRAIEQ